MPEPLPPPVIKAEDLKVERYTKDGQIVTRYVHKSGGQPVSLSETFHLVKDPTKFDPPPPA